MIRDVTGFLIAICLTLGQATAAEGDDISDHELGAEVTAELIAARAVQGNNVEVAAVDGVVTLSGEVADLLARDRATRITRSLKGVRSVVNHIEVKPIARTDKEMRADLDRFRKELGTDYIDILLLHCMTDKNWNERRHRRT